MTSVAGFRTEDIAAAALRLGLRQATRPAGRGRFWYLTSVTCPLVLTACTMVSVLALLAQTVWLGRRGEGGAGALHPEAPGPDEIRRHLFLGAFYVNPDDPRGWVPKLSGLGWTVNFRTRGQALLFIVLICVTLAAALLLTWSALAG